MSSNEGLIEQLKQHLVKQPINSSITKLEKTIPGISTILEHCPGVKLGEKIWNLFHPGEYIKYSTCPTCGAETKKFISLTSGYRQFCGNACASKDPKVLEGRSKAFKDPANRRVAKGEDSSLSKRHKEAARILAEYVPGTAKVLSEQELKIVYDQLPTINTNMTSTLMFSHPDVFEIIKNCFGRSCSEKLYNALNPTTRDKHLVCLTCGKPTDKYITIEKGYRLFCDNKCQMADQQLQAGLLCNSYT